jgi:hypothetical protein
VDPDPIGQKTCGSGGSGSGSATMVPTNRDLLFTEIDSFQQSVDEELGHVRIQLQIFNKMLPGTNSEQHRIQWTI